MSRPPLTEYTVQLLYLTQPVVDREGLLQTLRRRRRTDETRRGETETQLTFAFPEVRVRLDSGLVCAACSLSARPPRSTDLATALHQSWSWPGARNVVPNCTGLLEMVDLLGHRIPYRQRLALLYDVVDAILEAVPLCVAIHWKPAGHLVLPAEYLRVRKESRRLGAYPAVNVRMFQTGTADHREISMDTLGLGAIGLRDLQATLVGRDPSTLARVLFTTAQYLVDHGDVLKDGQKVQGERREERWVCRERLSLIEPQRAVVELIPDNPVETTAASR